VATDLRYRSLDIALLAALACIILQLIPLPVSLLSIIDPNAARLRESLWVVPTQSLGVPITIDPRNTAAALAIVTGAVAYFWACRGLSEAGATGLIVRSIAFIGLVCSLAAIVQRAENPELIYGFWRPQDAGARPYGPFVNRNHFATWAIMAVPLLFGYLLARRPPPRPDVQLTQRIAGALMQVGSTRMWLLLAVALMTLAVVLSTSRSGIVGLAAGLIWSAWLALAHSGRREETRSIRRWTVLQALGLAAAVIAFANFDALATRLDETTAVGTRGREAIWRVTGQLISDFPLTGTGAGTYPRAILWYEPPNPGYSTTSAHNQYLHIAAEGGAMFAFPVLAIMTLFLLRASRNLRDVGSPNTLVRAGALGGLVGVCVQSVWETGLIMPANAMTFAALAALAVRAPQGSVGGVARVG
jgi:O-antigen ligase